MKNLLLVLLILPLSSFLQYQNEQKIDGVWKLNKVIFNGKTIFLRDHFHYTLNYNFSLNKSWVKNKEDSITVTKQAQKRFNNSKNAKIEFLTDSTFCLTKSRSKSGISSNEKDFGIYKVQNDTLLLTKKSKRNRKMILKIDAKNERIFSSYDIKNHSMYIEYTK